MSRNARGEYKCIMCKGIIVRNTYRKRRYCSMECLQAFKYLRRNYKLRFVKCRLCGVKIPASKKYCSPFHGRLWRTYGIDITKVPN